MFCSHCGQECLDTAQFCPHCTQPTGSHVGYAVVPNEQGGGGLAIASLVLGCVNLIGWCVPLIGFPMGIVGLILGIKGLKSSKRGMAIAGIILNSATLLFTIINGIAGAMMYANGTHPFVNSINSGG